MPAFELTPEERAVLRPKRRPRVRPYFRLACVLILLAMIPLPWTKYHSCNPSIYHDFYSHAEIHKGADLLFSSPLSTVLTVAVLALALATPWLALHLDRVSRVLLDVFCATGLLLFALVTALRVLVMPPYPQGDGVLPAGACVLVILAITVMDASVAIVTDALRPDEEREPDDTG
jgi:MFS family permease